MRTLNTKRLLAVVSVLLCFALFVPSAFAEENQASQRGILNYQRELNLTDEQAKRIKSALDSYEKTAKELTPKLQKLEQEIKRLLDDGVKMEEIEPKIRESFSIRADILIADIKATREINKVLTVEQSNKWKSIRRQMQQKNN